MKKAITTLLAVAIVITTTGCATQGMGAGFSPILDRPNAAATQDLQECQQHATKVADAGQKAVAGAIIGALLGAAIMGAAGGRGYRNEAAGVGAIQGAVAGGVSGETDQRNIIRKCMAARGHTVLN